MAPNKFLYKVLIVLSLSVTAVILAACGSASPAPAVSLSSTDPEYKRIYGLGFAAGKASVTAIDQTACQGFINQATCQSFIDTALATVVYDATTCAEPIVQAQASWMSSQAACEQAGYGYPAITQPAALEHLKFSDLDGDGHRDWTCWENIQTPQVQVRVKPKPKAEEPPPAPPVEPPCPNCPAPPVEPPCPNCPVPPND